MLCTHCRPTGTGVLYKSDISILRFRVFVFLLDLFLATGFRAEDPFGLAVDIGLVLDRDAAEMAEDIFHLGIGVAAAGTAQIIDRFQAHEDVVNHGDDDDDTNRITPDNNDSDDRRLGAVVITSELIDG